MHASMQTANVIRIGRWMTCATWVYPPQSTVRYHPIHAIMCQAGLELMKGSSLHALPCKKHIRHLRELKQTENNAHRGGQQHQTCYKGCLTNVAVHCTAHCPQEALCRCVLPRQRGAAVVCYRGEHCLLAGQIPRQRNASLHSHITHG